MLQLRLFANAKAHLLMKSTALGGESKKDQGVQIDRYRFSTWRPARILPKLSSIN